MAGFWEGPAVTAALPCLCHNLPLVAILEVACEWLPAKFVRAALKLLESRITRCQWFSSNLVPIRPYAVISETEPCSACGLQRENRPS